MAKKSKYSRKYILSKTEADAADALGLEPSFIGQNMDKWPEAMLEDILKCLEGRVELCEGRDPEYPGVADDETRAAAKRTLLFWRRVMDGRAVIIRDFTTSED